jgi:fimbrial isopeptide formation D2 family protein
MLADVLALVPATAGLTRCHPSDLNTPARRQRPSRSAACPSIRRRWRYPVATLLALSLAVAAFPGFGQGEITGASTTITKANDVDDNSVAFGETFTYTLTIECSSNTEAFCDGAEIVDVLPPGVELVNAVGTANAIPDISEIDPVERTGTVRFNFDYTTQSAINPNPTPNVDQLPDGSSTQVTLIVKLQDEIDPSITQIENTAELTITNGEPDGKTTVTSSDTDVLSVDPLPDPVWTVTKRVNDNADKVELVLDADYSIQVCLTPGTYGTLTAFQVEDELPPEVLAEDVSNISDGGVFTDSPPTITWTGLSDLSSGCETLTYTVVYPDDNADDEWDRAPAASPGDQPRHRHRRRWRSGIFVFLADPRPHSLQSEALHRRGQISR